jgi:hypothetical protein
VSSSSGGKPKSVAGEGGEGEKRIRRRRRRPNERKRRNALDERPQESNRHHPINMICKMTRDALRRVSEGEDE